MEAFPKPWCITCSAQPACRATGQARGEYPACRLPPRESSPEDVARLFAWWRRFHRVVDGRLARVEAVLVERLARDRGYSEIFEPSVSFDRRGWHFLRFSYAFPGLRGAEEDALATLKELAAAFGGGVAAHFGQFARALDQACVEQVLFGLAYDGVDDWRVKLYLQFRSEAGADALRLARALLSARDLTALAGATPLHLCGLDLGAAGLVGAKLYFLHREVSSARTRELFGETLARLGERPWRNVLRIHRLRGAQGGGGARADEVDFHLAENDLLPRDVDAWLGGADSPYERLSHELPVALRRVSLTVGGGKMNGYYVLAG